MSALFATTVLVSGCASLNPIGWFATKPKPNVSTPMTPMTVANASRASVAYERDPKDPAAAIAYARALREFGSNDAAADVLARTARYHPEHPQLTAEYAKALTASGHSDEALEFFAKARQLGKPDWSQLSAEGIALDQLGKHSEARERYGEALKLSPDNPDILCNLALSHTLSGNLDEAEILLRRALKEPGAGPAARQNLSMVVGLQGRFSEAEGLARADLDPAAADHNVAVMKELFSQPQAWTAAREAGTLPKLAEAEPAPVVDPPKAAPAVAVAQTPLPKADVKRGQGLTAAVQPRRAAPPSAQSQASGAPKQYAESNGVDDTFFAFDW